MPKNVLRHIYFIAVATDPHFRLRVDLNPDTVMNLHGQCQPEYYIFQLSGFRILPFFSLFDCNFLLHAISFFNSFLNVFRPP